MRRRNLSQITVLLLSLAFLPGMRPQPLAEICDNGIDDDGNGLIDLNDPTCVCQPPEPLSQIPNPSFEERSCCPSGNSQLYCADTWLQASEATTDYYHRCGYFRREQFPVPEPIPDGDAYIGFRNGRFTGNNPNPNWKEYTGACLLSPLIAGNEYTFQFHIGFVNPTISPSMKVAFYGTTDCENLPFGSGNREYGCPLNGPGWQILGEVWVGGNNQWIQYKITTVPKENITAIAIGPECRELNLDINPYYFLDNLILADTKLFGPTIQATGHPCEETYTLTASQRPDASYQWYRNGIALVGETEREIQLNREEGAYQVLVTVDGTCFLSSAYQYRKPYYFSESEMKICPGQTYSFGRQPITTDGSYTETFANKNGCDSTVLLHVSVATDLQDTVEAYFFQGEEYKIGPYQFTAPTEKKLAFTTDIGCDSTVFFSLKEYPVYIPNAFSPNNDGNNDYFKIFGDRNLFSVESFRVFDRWGNLVFQQKEKDLAAWDGRNAYGEIKTGVYLYLVELKLWDGNRKILSGNVMVMH